MPADYDATIALARRGDGTAIENLCSFLTPHVQSEARRSAADLHQRPWFHALHSTGDLVQDIFLSILRNLSVLPQRGEKPLAKYLSVVSRNRTIDAIRFHENSRRDERRSLEGRNQLDAHESRFVDPQESAITREQITRYREVLATFPARDQSLLRERLENEVPFEELADRLGFASSDSARKMFHIARARLVVRLRAD